jgi:hypothetical protein
MSAKTFLVAILTVAIRLYRDGVICPRCAAAFAQALHTEVTTPRRKATRP